MEKGWRTSEFWMALGASLASLAVALGFAHAADAVREIMAIIAGFIPAVYGFYRTYLKRVDKIADV